MKNSELEEAMLEKQARVLNAVCNAYLGNGTEEDWAIICSECNVPKIIKITKENHVNHSVSISTSQQLQTSTSGYASIPMLSNY